MSVKASAGRIEAVAQFQGGHALPYVIRISGRDGIGKEIEIDAADLKDLEYVVGRLKSKLRAYSNGGTEPYAHLFD